MPVPKQHVLVCTGDSCRRRGGKKLCKSLAKTLEAKGLKRRSQVVAVDCFRQCGHGPMVLVYPDATWYAGVDPGDAARLVKQHLVDGKPLVDRLYREAK
jgi:(2Fe-2S) ferredoxin